MLWYKSWLETRWRFLIGLLVLILSAGGTVLAYPEVVKLLALMPKIDLEGTLGRRISESAELTREYRGYIWSQWFTQNMTQQWGLFAVLLGTGGLLSQASGRGTLFTLSLPATRNRLLAVRSAIGLTELLVLAVVPSLIVPLFSPAVGQRYGVGDALVHASCMFAAGALLYTLTVLLSTVFTDIWRPPLIVLCGAIVVSVSTQLLGDLSWLSLFPVMSAETYFRHGRLPWLGLLTSAGASALALYVAARNLARRDF